MSAEPILEAEAIIATAVRDALQSYVGSYNSRPKVYYQLAEQGAPRPLLIFQLQSDITPAWRVGSASASVLVTVKALAESAKAARELLAAATPGMSGLSYPGYTLTARYVAAVRVEAARRELETSRATIDAIAQRVGFGTAETMRRTFLRRIGVAPDDYRRRFRHAATT